MPKEIPDEERKTIIVRPSYRP